LYNESPLWGEKPQTCLWSNLIHACCAHPTGNKYNEKLNFYKTKLFNSTNVYDNSLQLGDEINNEDE